MVIEIMKTFHTNGNILENGNMKQEERKNHQVHDADTFLEYRRKQEQVHLNRIKGSTNPLDAILTIELNTTELCNRKCIFCNMNVIENEFHFVLVCPFYRDLRNKILPRYYCTWPTITKFQSLMQTKQSGVLNKLAKFVYHAFAKRKLNMT